MQQHIETYCDVILVENSFRHFFAFIFKKKKKYKKNYKKTGGGGGVGMESGGGY